MCGPEEGAADVVTHTEMTGTIASAEVDKPHVKPKSNNSNAFTELMSPKKPKRKSPPSSRSNPASASAKKPQKMADIHAQRRLNTTHGRDALIAYTQAPESFPADRVIMYDEKFVVINDLYPKSSIHLLLLPRDPVRQLQHPFDAFATRTTDDAAFLALVNAKVADLKVLAASELRRRFGKFSASELKRTEALERDDSDPEYRIPEGKDWDSCITAGVHAHPSMTHLHVHVLSTDRVSECMRHRKHYNSFATPFLVPMRDMPLEEGDVRRLPGREGYLERDLVCWRCGRNFGNKFARLKEHLEEEFEVWKRE